MNPQLLFNLLLRSVATLANLQGQAKLSESLTLVADAHTSGQNVDAHMQKVADDLAAGVEPDTDDLRARIREESARLQGS